MKSTQKRPNIQYEYLNGNKRKIITTITGFMSYCTRRKFDFFEKLKELNIPFSYHFREYTLKTPRCRTCYKNLKISKIENTKIYFVMHNCGANNTSAVNFNSFLTVLSPSLAKKEYEKYVKNKTNKWRPVNCDTGSLKYFTEK